MKSKLLISLIITIFASVGVMKTDIHLNKNSLNPFTFAEVEALAEEETINGGTLPPAVVNCDGGNSGTCFYVSVEEVMYGKCRFDCAFSGRIDDHCSSFMVGLINFCNSLVN